MRTEGLDTGISSDLVSDTAHWLPVLIQCLCCNRPQFKSFIRPCEENWLLGIKNRAAVGFHADQRMFNPLPSHSRREDEGTRCWVGLWFNWYKNTFTVDFTYWEADLSILQWNIPSSLWYHYRVDLSLVLANENHTWWWNRGPLSLGYGLGVSMQGRLGQTGRKNRECSGWYMFSDPQRLTNRLSPSISGEQDRTKTWQED